MTEVRCSSCRADLLLPIGHTGATYTCPFCRRSIAVPEQEAGARATSPSPPAADATAFTAAEPMPTLGAAHSSEQADAPDPLQQARQAGTIVPFSPFAYVPIALIAVVAAAGILMLITYQLQRSAASAVAMNNMKQISLACATYHDVHKHLPTSRMLTDAGEPVELSWRVSILPYIDQFALFKTFDQAVHWDDPPNNSQIARMPAIYADPERNPGQAWLTHFQYFTGPGTLFPDNDNVKLDAGLLPTNFFFAEAAHPVTWTKPDDIAVRPGEPLPLPEPTFLVGSTDGTVRSIDRSRVSDAVILWYLKPNPGELPPLD
jgi:hypothetical protein